MLVSIKAPRNGGRLASPLLLSSSNMTRQVIYFGAFEAHGERDDKSYLFLGLKTVYE